MDVTAALGAASAASISSRAVARELAHLLMKALNLVGDVSEAGECMLSDLDARRGRVELALHEVELELRVDEVGRSVLRMVSVGLLDSVAKSAALRLDLSEGLADMLRELLLEFAEQ